MNKKIKKRLGISVYPTHENKLNTIKYIENAYKAGFRRIFTNLLEIKKDEFGEKTMNLFQEIFIPARNMGFEIILDVNPKFYEEWKKDPKDYDFAKKIGATGLRFDEDYKGVVEAAVANNQENFKLELNASAKIETLNNALKLGGNSNNIISCHNFYPMKYTGLDFEKFIERSTKIKEKGIKVAAFIGLDKKYHGIGPWKVNDGLCTVEEHRNISTVDQLIEMLAIDAIDDICIGEQADINKAEELFTSIKEVLDSYNQFIENDEVVLKVDMQDSTNIMDEIIFQPKVPHRNRYDMNAYFFRSTMPRIWYKDATIKPLNSGNKLQIGDVVIVNENKGRYKGELHIITKPFIDEDQSKNVVGKVVPQNIHLLKWIKDTDKNVIIKKA